MSPVRIHKRPSPVVPRRALAVLVFAVGCNQVFGVDGPEGGFCGDGELLFVEECDDGSNAAGDGCDPACKIEPGFECRTMNQGCLPVVGLSRGPTTTVLDAVGDLTDNTFNFNFTCPPGEVVIGFEGYANLVTEDNLGRLRAVCGSLALAPNGDALVTRSIESEFFGNSQSDPLLTVTCAQNEVATGWTPTTNTYISGFQWACQRLSHTSGALRFDAPMFRAFGPSIGETQSKQSCSPREAVSSMIGRAGQTIDVMGLGCSVISTVLCGDGEMDPPETCDDGNLTRGDGCGRDCQLE